MSSYEIRRKDFREKYKTVFGAYPPKAAQDLLARAVAVRDAAMHGKMPTPAQVRNAVASVLLYAETINDHLQVKAGFCPFHPDLRGFKGAAQGLDKSTTRWLLKGMGFIIS